MIKIIQKVTTAVAIILWIAVVVVIAIAIAKHQFWNLTPIIAHNRPQNCVGWMIVVAFICSVVSPSLKLIN